MLIITTLIYYIITQIKTNNKKNNYNTLIDSPTAMTKAKVFKVEGPAHFLIDTSRIVE